MPGESSDLAQQVRSLQRQVDDLTQLVRGLVLSREPVSHPSEREEASAVSVSAGEQRSQAADSQVSSSSIYNQLAVQIPPVPDFCLRLCSLLSAGANRAWEAGHWARFTIEGRLSKPRPSQPCDVPNTVVGRAPV